MALDEAADRASTHAAPELFVGSFMIRKANFGMMGKRWILGMQPPYAYGFKHRAKALAAVCFRDV